MGDENCPVQSTACNRNCYETETTDNNFIALRQGGDANTLYAEFQTGDLDAADIDFSDKADFVEYYDLDTDPWEMDNLAPKAPPAALQERHDALMKWYKCAGTSCP